MCETGCRRDRNIIHFVYKNKEVIRVEVSEFQVLISESGNI